MEVLQNKKDESSDIDVLKEKKIIVKAALDTMLEENRCVHESSCLLLTSTSTMNITSEINWFPQY